MGSADLYAWLIEATLATSVAMLAVLALRKPFRAAFGAATSHAAWSAVPIALLATLLPAAEADVATAPLAVIRAPIRMLVTEAPPSSMPDIAASACIAWLLGCVAFAAFLCWQQRRFMRGLGKIADRGDGLLLADTVAGLPAAVGVWNARIVMPADAMSRYDTVERSLMLAHEREHIARGDLLANAFVAMLRCLFWFNPLVHVAARRFRDDQELACDARVIARHPQSRRAYGEAMLKTQMATSMLPLGCHWGQSHPLKERIEMLKQPLPSSVRSAAGRGMVIAILLVSGYAAWAAQPDAPVAAASKGEISAYITLRVDDGKPMNMRVLTEPGRAFSVRNDEGGKQYAIEGTVTRTQHAGKPALGLDLRIAEDGKEVATPKIVVRNGSAGSIQSGQEIRGKDGRTAFKGIRMDIILIDSAVQPVATVSSGSTSSITMIGNQISMRDVVAKLARERGMTVNGLELIPAEQEVSFGLEGVPLETVLELLGDESGLDARVNGKTVEFTRKAGNAAVEVVRTPPPVYPVDVLKHGVAGTVLLVVDVAEDGSVSGAKVDRSAGDERLDAAALDAVKQWKFKPALKDGKGVAGQVRVPVEFAMDDEHDVQVKDPRAVRANSASKANAWSSYDRMVHSLSASWEKPAPPADEC